MKVWEVMSAQVIRIHPQEPVSVAARILQRYNIGLLAVCDNDGKLCGVVTDRDLVVRCLAAGRRPENTPVGVVMSSAVVCARPAMEASMAAYIMGRQQIRRLPVVENGRLCGVISLGDLAIREESNPDAADALGQISSNVSNL